MERLDRIYSLFKKIYRKKFDSSNWQDHMNLSFLLEEIKKEEDNGEISINYSGNINSKICLFSPEYSEKNIELISENTGKEFYYDKSNIDNFLSSIDDLDVIEVSYHFATSDLIDSITKINSSIKKKIIINVNVYNHLFFDYAVVLNFLNNFYVEAVSRKNIDIILNFKIDLADSKCRKCIFNILTAFNKKFRFINNFSIEFFMNTGISFGDLIYVIDSINKEFSVFLFAHDNVKYNAEISFSNGINAPLVIVNPGLDLTYNADSKQFVKIENNLISVKKGESAAKFFFIR